MAPVKKSKTASSPLPAPLTSILVTQNVSPATKALVAGTLSAPGTGWPRRSDHLVNVPTLQALLGMSLPSLKVFVHRLPVLLAATINTLSLCRSKTEPAVTSSDLSSLVLVGLYSDSNLFLTAAAPWASA